MKIDDLQQISERAAYQAIEKNNPQLLKSICNLIARNFSSEQIIRLCMKMTKQPRHRIAFVGCAADYVIRNAPEITSRIQ